MNMEETIRRRWEKFEPMRIRIMQEAYDCADRNEVEAYNSIKVMCSEVLRLAEEMILAEREACAKVQEFVCSTGFCRFTLTQTGVGIGERGMQAYEEAKKRGWVGISDEMEMPKQEPK